MAHSRPISEHKPMIRLWREAEQQTLHFHRMAEPCLKLHQSTICQVRVPEFPGRPMPDGHGGQRMSHNNQRKNHSNNSSVEASIPTGDRSVGSEDAGGRGVGSEDVEDRGVGSEDAGDRGIGSEDAGDREIGSQDAGDREIGRGTTREGDIRTETAGWYVVQVMSGQEHIVRKLILNRFADEAREYSENPNENANRNVEKQRSPSGQQEHPPYLIEECFIPMRERKIKYRGKWQLTKERILPGYVFIVTRNPEQVFQSLKQVPRFTSLLGKTDAGFIALNEQEVHFLSRFGDQEHVSHLSQVAVETGSRVRILEGDLLNYEGEIVKINLHKRVAIVRIPFMRSSVDVHLGIEIVEKIDDRADQTAGRTDSKSHMAGKTNKVKKRKDNRERRQKRRV